MPLRGRSPAGIGPLLGLLILLAASPARAERTGPDFPRLTGRLVDAAGLLGPESRAAITAKLEAHEDKTSDQLVVATVPNLQGLTVEEYGNRLFRAWGLGARSRNNGVLLLVAPRERKVRIEVGYGLEGALTDALSKVVIATAITPKFKRGDFAGGIDAGVDAILAILAGDARDWQRRAEVRAEVRADEPDPVQVVVFLIVLIVLIALVWRMSGGARGRRGGFVVLPGPSSGGWSGGVSGGFGGGFSGGGGSSGGGGASGDW